MNASIVTIDHGAPVVSTTTIADQLGRPHKNVLRVVRSLIDDGTIDRLKFEPTNYTDSHGREQPAYSLTEDGFLIAMPFIGGRIARAGQKRLVTEFRRVRNQIARADKQRAALEWQGARADGKLTRRAETDAIKEFVGYAKAQGSEHADRYYTLLTKAAYSPLFEKPKGTNWRGVREALDAQQLVIVATVEHVIAAALQQGMDAGDPYKEIYRLAADRAKTIGRMLPKQAPALLEAA